MGAYYGTKTYHDQRPDQKTINWGIIREKSSLSKLIPKIWLQLNPGMGLEVSFGFGYHISSILVTRISELPGLLPNTAHARRLLGRRNNRIFLRETFAVRYLAERNATVVAIERQLH